MKKLLAALVALVAINASAYDVTNTVTIVSNIYNRISEEHWITNNIKNTHTNYHYTNNVYTVSNVTLLVSQTNVNTTATYDMGRSMLSIMSNDVNSAKASIRSTADEAAGSASRASASASSASSSAASAQNTLNNVNTRGSEIINAMNSKQEWFDENYGKLITNEIYETHTYFPNLETNYIDGAGHVQRYILVSLPKLAILSSGGTNFTMRLVCSGTINTLVYDRIDIEDGSYAIHLKNSTGSKVWSSPYTSAQDLYLDDMYYLNGKWIAKMHRNGVYHERTATASFNPTSRTTFTKTSEQLTMYIESLGQYSELSKIADIATTDAVNELKTRIGTAETNIENINTSVSGLTTRMGTAESRIGSAEANINATRATLRDLAEQYTNDVRTINTSVSGLTTRMGAAESRIGSAEANISSTTAALGNLAEQHTNDVRDLNTSVSGLTTRIGTAENDITNVKKYSDILRKSVGYIPDRFVYSVKNDGAYIGDLIVSVSKRSVAASNETARTINYEYSVTWPAANNPKVTTLTKTVPNFGKSATPSCNLVISYMSSTFQSTLTGLPVDANELSYIYSGWSIQASGHTCVFEFVGVVGVELSSEVASMKKSLFGSQKYKSPGGTVYDRIDVYAMATNGNKVAAYATGQQSATGFTVVGASLGYTVHFSSSWVTNPNTDANCWEVIPAFTEFTGGVLKLHFVPTTRKSINAKSGTTDAGCVYILEDFYWSDGCIYCVVASYLSGAFKGRIRYKFVDGTYLSYPYVKVSFPDSISSAMSAGTYDADMVFDSREGTIMGTESTAGLIRFKTTKGSVAAQGLPVVFPENPSMATMINMVWYNTYGQ